MIFIAKSFVFQWKNKWTPLNHPKKKAEIMVVEKKLLKMMHIMIKVSPEQKMIITWSAEVEAELSHQSNGQSNLMTSW